jgi:hypothetical protein
VPANASCGSCALPDPKKTPLSHCRCCSSSRISSSRRLREKWWRHQAYPRSCRYLHKLSLIFNIFDVDVVGQRNSMRFCDTGRVTIGRRGQSARSSCIFSNPISLRFLSRLAFQHMHQLRPLPLHPTPSHRIQTLCLLSPQLHPPL